MPPEIAAPEGGLPCYKGIIDNRNALVQQMACMEASMQLALHGSGWQPGEKQLEKWLAATKQVAEVAAEIEKDARANW